ncbi:MAG: cytochrome b [Gammaproteobacteria bacterium]|nr:MAG: cytochrome b [Gammaproteobacteria bacterium]PHR83898.1 MAG: cytochrome b [Colwellia sp.]
MNNTQTNYGYVSIFFHWLSALSIFTLFGLGYYMVELTYYHEWYKTAPELHKSIGVLLFVIMVVRLVWRYKQVTPAHLTSHSTLERKAGKLIHSILYLLIFIIMISGYLISTADGRGIDVFALFIIPGFGSFIENQEDIAGLIHQWLAYLLITLSLLHAIAALKHHFIDKDKTLNRMIGKRQKN